MTWRGVSAFSGQKADGKKRTMDGSAHPCLPEDLGGNKNSPVNDYQAIQMI